MQLFGQRGAGRLQAGDLGQSVAHLAVQAGVFDGDRHVIGQQLHHLAVLGVEHPRRLLGQHAEDAHQLTLPPDRHGHAGLGVAASGSGRGESLRVVLDDDRCHGSPAPAR